MHLSCIALFVRKRAIKRKDVEREGVDMSTQKPPREPRQIRSEQDLWNTIAAIVFFAIAALFMTALAIFSFHIPPIGAERNLAQLVPHVMLFLGSAFSALAGLVLLEASNPSVPEVLPPHDRAMLEPAIKEGKEGAIDLYMRPRSMRGVSGFFQKLGLNGLPLATIFLTLIFCAMALITDEASQANFFDLAKLTLGAFIGSFVQRTATRTNPTIP